MDDFEREIKIDFLNEASDLLVQAESYFIKLESEPENRELIDAIFRVAHSLKGTSRAVGFGQIAEITHVAENLLLKLKNNELQVNGVIVDVLLKFNDQINLMVCGLKENIEKIFEVGGLVDELSRVVNDPIIAINNVAETEKFSFLQEDKAPERDVFGEEEEEVTLGLNSLENPIQAENKLNVLDADTTAIDSSQSTIEKSKLSISKNETKKNDETIRVSLSRLSQLGDLVGELVILQSAVESALASQPSEVKTRRALSKICKDIQEMSMSLRMVPVGGAFQKLQRIVRDTSKALNKKVELNLIGEDTEIDRTVLEQLSDPLVHLIRNSVDHGIEAPHDRVLSGKVEHGTVEVMAFHEGSHLVIQITDDGNGMDPEKLRQKAIQKGIIPSTKILSEQESLNLIFAAGFSTKDQVSEVSGRGVGMDVVKTNIQALGGEIKLQSKKGVGSCIKLQLPLTMGIIDGILIRCCEQRFIIPRNQIHEIHRLDKELVHFVAGKVPLYRLRDEVVPLYFLADEIGQAEKSDTIALIVRTSSIVFAVAIEDVVSQQQVVVKPPTSETNGRKGIMGTTILGDGKPSLILDLMELFSSKFAKIKSVA